MDCIALIPNQCWLICWVSSFYIRFPFIITISSDLGFHSFYFWNNVWILSCLGLLLWSLPLSSVTDSRSWRVKYWEWLMSFKPWKTRLKRTVRRSKWTKPCHTLSPTLLRWEQATLLRQCDKCVQDGQEEGMELVSNFRHGMFLNNCHSDLQLLDVDPNDQEEDGANIDLDSQRKGKCAVIKTSTRQVRSMCPARCGECWKGPPPAGFAYFGLFPQTYFLPVIGLVDAEKLKPGDLVVSEAVVTVRYDAY